MGCIMKSYIKFALAYALANWIVEKIDERPNIKDKKH